MYNGAKGASVPRTNREPLHLGTLGVSHTQFLPQLGAGKPLFRAASSTIILTPAEKPMIFLPHRLHWR